MGVAEEVDYSIKPEAVTPAISTADWPLLLKNYDQCAPSLSIALTRFQPDSQF